MSEKAIECPLCGTKVSVSSGHAHVEIRCPACNTVLNQGPPSAVAGVGTTPLAAVDVSAAAQAPPGPTAALGHYLRKRKALRSVVWGGAGAVAGGVIMALISRRLLPEGGPATMFGGAEFGVFFGFLLGCVWGMVTSYDMSYAVGTGLAAVVGLVLAVMHHILEATLISPGGEPLYLTAIVGFGAGAFVGFFSVWYKNYRDEL